MRLDGTYNLANREIVAGLQAGLGAECAKARARGDENDYHRIALRPVRQTQSAALRGYYYAVVVEAFREFLAEQQPDADKATAHRRLKLECGLKIEEANPRTGELETTGTLSLADLKTPELWAYVERARAWLDEWGIPTPDPDPMHHTRPARRKAVPA